jgi:hypothetical protein
VGTSDAAVLPIKPSVATSAVYMRRKPLTRDLSSAADASTMPARPWSERHESKSYPGVAPRLIVENIILALVRMTVT